LVNRTSLLNFSMASKAFLTASQPFLANAFMLRYLSRRGEMGWRREEEREEKEERREREGRERRERREKGEKGDRGEKREWRYLNIARLPELLFV
jgi:hypothetical protein